MLLKCDCPQQKSSLLLDFSLALVLANLLSVRERAGLWLWLLAYHRTSYPRLMGPSLAAR
jgi:hypothetical protein